MKREPHTLVIRFGDRAARMLLEFVNSRDDEKAFLRFKSKWEKGSDLKWESDHEEFIRTRDLVREIWQGKRERLVRLDIMSGLGMETAPHYADEGERVEPTPIYVDWENGQLALYYRSLNQIVWLALLQHSRELGVCEGEDEGCPTPYFLKYRPKQEFCSTACAKPRQREHKRHWWREHGREWQQKRREERKRKKDQQSRLAGRRLQPWQTDENGGKR